MTTDEALNEVQERVQWCRENGETDLRGILWFITDLREKLQVHPDMPVPISDDE